MHNSVCFGERLVCVGVCVCVCVCLSSASMFVQPLKTEKGQMLL